MLLAILTDTFLEEVCAEIVAKKEEFERAMGIPNREVEKMMLIYPGDGLKQIFHMIRDIMKRSGVHDKETIARNSEVNLHELEINLQSIQTFMNLE